jgi:8-oxo-dGTP pyrophosphatase MutT (NUDIX family)
MTFGQVSDPESVPLRDAATVVLVRGGVDERPIEVFLMRRVKQMAFAGGMTVFPGGGVDRRDAEADLAWIGPGEHWWAERFNTDAATAQALVCAAVRELFEECGVLLAARPDGTFPDTSALSAERAALVDKSLSFAQFLREHDLSLRADLLRPLAHWITPIGESRRYDTRFFLAALPEGQQADGETTEAAETAWATPRAALEAWDDGKHFLLPPTWTQLKEISSFGSLADLLAAEREIETILPEVVSTGERMRVRFDGESDYRRYRTDLA